MEAASEKKGIASTSSAYVRLVKARKLTVLVQEVLELLEVSDLVSLGSSHFERVFVVVGEEKKVGG